ncbi:MAG: Helix-turn-helix domain [Chloroflexia bacterium]|nr:Helix-turn-helix domain [Chloroflexia bacterium]
MPKLSLADLVKDKRTALGLSLRDVAQAAGISHSLVSRIERNEVRVPGLAVLQALSGVLEIELDKLLMAAGIKPEASLRVVPDVQALALASELSSDPMLGRFVRAWRRLPDRDRERLARVAADLADLQANEAASRNLETVEQRNP